MEKKDNYPKIIDDFKMHKSPKEFCVKMEEEEQVLLLGFYSLAQTKKRAIQNMFK